jgi:hypothetical protein
VGTQKQLNTSIDSTFERDETEEDLYRYLKQKPMHSDKEMMNYIKKRISLTDPNLEDISNEINGENHSFFKMLEEMVKLHMGGPINKINTYTKLCE